MDFGMAAILALLMHRPEALEFTSLHLNGLLFCGVLSLNCIIYFDV